MTSDRLTMLRAVLLTALLLSVPFPAVAQDSVRAPLDFDAIRQQVEADMRNQRSTLSPPVLPEGAPLTDSLTRARQQEALQAYFKYRVHGFDHRLRVFEWQLLSSRIIFVVVILLVLLGVYFSGVQFHRGLREARAQQAASDAETPSDEPVTEIEASMQGIKVSSSTLGVIILVISLAFFYLYLVFVYPIKEIL
jgi:hypothetical protein